MAHRHAGGLPATGAACSSGFVSLSQESELKDFSFNDTPRGAPYGEGPPRPWASARCSAALRPGSRAPTGTLCLSSVRGALFPFPDTTFDPNIPSDLVSV